jgi:hypothetical protein
MTFWHLLIHRLDSDFFTHAIRACRTSADFLVRSEAEGGGKRDILSVGRATAAAAAHRVEPSQESALRREYRPLVGLALAIISQT